MTCEVAVMNKHGIALAADSAVTLGAGEKIYHGAEKLFALSPSMPIGVMTYGNANLMARADPKADRQHIFTEFAALIERDIDQQYRQPLMAAVDALPRHDLARMAEALV